MTSNTFLTPLKAFECSCQASDRKNSKLEFTKLKMNQVEWIEYLEAIDEGSIPGTFRHMESLYAVEDQIRFTSKKRDMNTEFVKDRSRAGAILGGIFAKKVCLPSEYRDEYHEFLQEKHKRAFTKEEVADILNQKLYKMVGEPMVRAYYNKCGKPVRPMGEAYWEETFMGGSLSIEEIDDTLDDIKKRRGERNHGGGGGGGRARAVETAKDRMIEEQRQEIERMKAKYEKKAEPVEEAVEEEEETEEETEEESDDEEEEEPKKQKKMTFTIKKKKNKKNEDKE